MRRKIRCQAQKREKAKIFFYRQQVGNSVSLGEEMVLQRYRRYRERYLSNGGVSTSFTRKLRFYWGKRKILVNFLSTVCQLKSGQSGVSGAGSW